MVCPTCRMDARAIFESAADWRSALRSVESPPGRLTHWSTIGRRLATRPTWWLGSTKSFGASLMLRGEEREDGALRVRDDGEPQSWIGARWRNVDRGAQFLGLFGGSIAIRDKEVTQPVGRRVWVALRGGRDAADKLLAILDVQIRIDRLVLAGDELPSEELFVKRLGSLRIGRAQVRPTQRAVDAGDADTDVALGLPHREKGASGILK